MLPSPEAMTTDKQTLREQWTQHEGLELQTIILRDIGKHMIVQTHLGS